MPQHARPVARKPVPAFLSPTGSVKTAAGGDPSRRAAGRHIASPIHRRAGTVRPIACRIPPARERFRKSSTDSRLLTRKNYSSIHTQTPDQRLSAVVRAMSSMGNVGQRRVRAPFSGRAVRSASYGSANSRCPRHRAPSRHGSPNSSD